MLGKFRGKVGATVFRTEAGIGQIASEYNPNPKNPRTMLQTQQRVKMSLAGQISKSIPASFLVGLDANNRKARSMFVSNILKNAEVGAGANAGEYKATIDPGKIVFSKGALVKLEDTGYTQDEVEIIWPSMKAPEGSDMVGLRIIALAGERGVYTQSYKQDVVFTDGQAPANTSIVINELALGNQGVAAVYFIPLIKVESGNGTLYENLLGMINEVTDAGQLSAIVDTWVAAQSGYVQSYLFSVFRSPNG